MVSHERKREVLDRLLQERRGRLPRPARQFLEALVLDQELLGAMQFCAQEERGRLRNSVMIATVETMLWAVMIGNDPERGLPGTRARLALEGLDLSPYEVMERLRRTPVWFLATDHDLFPVSPGLAERLDFTAHRLAAMSTHEIRRRVWLDQMDAALEYGDQEALERIRCQMQFDN